MIILLWNYSQCHELTFHYLPFVFGYILSRLWNSRTIQVRGKKVSKYSTTSRRYFEKEPTLCFISIHSFFDSRSLDHRSTPSFSPFRAVRNSNRFKLAGKKFQDSFNTPPIILKYIFSKTTKSFPMSLCPPTLSTPLFSASSTTKRTRIRGRGWKAFDKGGRGRELSRDGTKLRKQCARI